MKKKDIRFIIFLILSLFIGTQLYVSGTDAKTSRKNAITAFKKLLDQGRFSYKDENGSSTVEIKSFCLLDIDQNGVPELVIKNASAEESFSTRYVFFLKGKRAVCAGDYYQKGDAKLQYSQKYKAIEQWWWTNGIGGAGARLMQLKKGKLKGFKYIYECLESPESTNMVYTYGTSDYTDAKEVSKKKYDSVSKKYFSKLKEISFHDNSSGNIKKYLK